MLIRDEGRMKSRVQIALVSLLAGVVGLTVWQLLR
ncbi:hypothetical protein SBV1_1740039 [Verrucomicrobia bacterium]|nr:hypothetical protein SBV1_1740039 [Verrucomicrobiota bacterium]